MAKEDLKGSRKPFRSNNSRNLPTSTRLIMFSTKQDESSQDRIQCQVAFRTPVDVAEFTPEIQSAAIETLTGSLSCARDDIQIIDVSQEHVLLMLEMPSPAFERFMKLGQANDPIIESLEISQVKEVLREHHNIENIRLMLSKMFTTEEFRTFCQKHFATVFTVFKEISSELNKALMIDTLLDHARQTSRIHHILVFTEKHNAKTYGKYGPYYKSPRNFPAQQQKEEKPRSSQPILRPDFFNLTLQEFAKAVIMGLGVATGVAFLLQRVIMLPFPESLADLLYLLEGAKLLLGILVGEVVSKGAHFKRGKLLAIISVSCYCMGYTLGASLVFMTSPRGFPLLNMFDYGLLAFFMGAISSFFSLGALIGIYFAYRYAR